MVFIFCQKVIFMIRMGIILMFMATMNLEAITILQQESISKVRIINLKILKIRIKMKKTRNRLPKMSLRMKIKTSVNTKKKMLH